MSSRTKLDALLDHVKKGVCEVTLNVDGFTQVQVERVLKAAKDRGLHAAFDDRFILVRAM